MQRESSDTESVTRQLADVLTGTAGADLPADVRVHARRAIIDWLASALAGARERPARLVQQVAATFGASSESTVFAGGRASAAAAAFANGAASHVLELDDIHKQSTVHGAAPVISAAVAMAERQHADGPGLITAVTLGYEAAFRIGETVNPSHYLTRRYPGAWPARVTLTLDSGPPLTGESDYPRGNPGNPVPDDALDAKFLQLVGPIVGDGPAGHVLEALKRLETCTDVAALFHALPLSGAASRS